MLPQLLLSAGSLTYLACVPQARHDYQPPASIRAVTWVGSMVVLHVGWHVDKGYIDKGGMCA